MRWSQGRAGGSVSHLVLYRLVTLSSSLQGRKFSIRSTLMLRWMIGASYLCFVLYVGHFSHWHVSSSSSTCATLLANVRIIVNVAPRTSQMSKVRMQQPCRGIGCRHVQCFDALSYLHMNERRPAWLCPVCHKPAKWQDLRIDGYGKKIVLGVSCFGWRRLRMCGGGVLYAGFLCVVPLCSKCSLPLNALFIAPFCQALCLNSWGCVQQGRHCTGTRSQSRLARRFNCYASARHACITLSRPR